jgi:hypothetical protein
MDRLRLVLVHQMGRCPHQHLRYDDPHVQFHRHNHLARDHHHNNGNNVLNHLPLSTVLVPRPIVAAVCRQPREL